jgi:putative ABC transport system substrate-binding protein
LQVKALREAAPALGVTLQVREIRSADDLPSAFDAGVRERAEGLAMTSASIFSVNRSRVTELAARHRLPAVYPFAAMVEESGGLMAYFADERDLHRRAAAYVDRILKGAKPGDLPVQQPNAFRLLINLRTAKALGLTISPALMLQAHRVIECHSPCAHARVIVKAG